MKTLVCQAPHLELNPLLCGQPVKLKPVKLGWYVDIVLYELLPYLQCSVFSVCFDVDMVQYPYKMEFLASIQELTNTWVAVFDAVKHHIQVSNRLVGAMSLRLMLIWGILILLLWCLITMTMMFLSSLGFNTFSTIHCFTCDRYSYLWIFCWSPLQPYLGQ